MSYWSSDDTLKTVLLDIARSHISDEFVEAVIEQEEAHDAERREDTKRAEIISSQTGFVEGCS